MTIPIQIYVYIMINFKENNNLAAFPSYLSGVIIVIRVSANSTALKLFNMNMQQLKYNHITT